MPKFVIKAKYYASFEYDKFVDIQADSPEEAAAKFEEMAKTRGSGVIDFSGQVDKPFNIEGSYRVFEIPAGTNEDDVLERDEADLEAQSFKGPA